MRELKGPGPIDHLAMSADGRVAIARSGKKGVLQAFDLAKGKAGQTWPAETVGDVDVLALTADGARFAHGCRRTGKTADGRRVASDVEWGIWVYDVKKGDYTSALGTVRSLSSPDPIVMPSNDRLLTTVYAGRYELQVHELLRGDSRLLERIAMSGRVLTISRDGSRAVAVGGRGSAVAVELPSGKPLFTAKMKRGGATRAAVSPDGSTFAALGFGGFRGPVGKGSIAVWDRAGKTLFETELVGIGNSKLPEVAFTEDGIATFLEFSGKGVALWQPTASRRLRFDCKGAKAAALGGGTLLVAAGDRLLAFDIATEGATETTTAASKPGRAAKRSKPTAR